MREIRSSVDDVTGGRIFRVNGRRVFVRGGNYIASDAMMRTSRERWALVPLGEPAALLLSFSP